MIPTGRPTPVDGAATGRSSRSESDHRGQSEVVGVLLLTGVVALLVGLVGVQVLGTTDRADEPVVALDASVDASSVELQHGGGDGLDSEDVEVVLQGTATERYDLGSFTVVQGDGGTFEAGERWRHAHSLSGSVRILVVRHGETESVLLDTVETVPAP